MKTWKKLSQNHDLFSRYFVKESIIKSIRKFYEEKHYHELESPILTTALPTERYLEILSLKATTKNHKFPLFLIPSTESFNKKILAAGLGNHFVITKVFRGMEEIDKNHSIEFTMAEMYEIGGNYISVMNELEMLLRKIRNDLILKKLLKNRLIQFRGNSINIDEPFYRFSVRELLRKIRIELEEIYTLEKIKGYLESKKYKIDNSYDWQACYELLFVSEIEPLLPTDKPVFIYDFPKLLCPLTKVKSDDKLVSEKVELYIDNIEIANGYSELNDYKEQKKRFEEEFEARKTLDKIEIPIDTDLLEAIKTGIGEVSGVGLGIDRLAMIFANADSISDINFFPLSEVLE